MSAIPLRRITEEEYLEIERLATYKSEFYDGVMYPVQPPPGVVGMAGATIDHNQIKDNLSRELGNALAGGPCRALSSDMRVRSAATGHQAYPDVVVFCGPPVFPLKNRRDVIANPTLVVEVLSDSTEEYDRGAKFESYRTIDTLKEYVLVAQNRVRVERFVRQPDGTWAATTFSDPAGVLAFESVPVAIPLSAVYRHVEFPADPPR